VASHLVTVRDGVVVALKTWANDRETDALLVASDPRIADFVRSPSDVSAPPFVDDLRRLCAARKYLSYAVLDAEGRILASPGAQTATPVAETPVAEKSGGTPPVSPSDWPKFHRGQLTAPVHCPVDLNDLQGHSLRGLPVMLVGAPVNDPTEGRPLATVVLVIDPDQSFTQVLETGRSGKSGETYAFNADALMVSNSRFNADLRGIGLLDDRPDSVSLLTTRVLDPGVNLVSRPRSSLADTHTLTPTRMAEAAIRGVNGVDAEGYNDYRGVPVVGAWYWFPEYGFGIAYEIDFEEAYASATALGFVLLGLFVPLALGAIVSEWHAHTVRGLSREQRAAIAELSRQSTRLEDTNRQLREAHHRLSAANDAKSNFLANMSHEIRSPLNAILGFIDVMRLERDALPPETRDDYLDIIHRSGKHLLGLINDVLDLSKIEAGRMEFERTSVDPTEIIEEVVSIMRARALEKQIGFTLRYASPLPRRIQTDPLRLRQILINLIGNAIKFTREGEVSLVVSVGEGPAANRIRCEIRDTGHGIPTTSLERIFEPFSQADGTIARRHGGTGLGLAISRKFALALGGDITVTSQPEVGSVFTASVDMGDVHAEPVETVDSTRTRDRRKSTEVDRARESLPRGLKILVVDDADVNRRLLRVLLNRAGCVVSEAVDGMDAQRAVRTELPDIVLMDMQMPRMDGYSATRRLRASGYRGRIIACTADAMDSCVTQCRAAGCDDFLPKPLDTDVMFDVLIRAAKSLAPTATPTPATDAILTAIDATISTPDESAVPA
jgi:signal transduction histidine kinase/FixJ family two-component response regulator